MYYRCSVLFLIMPVRKRPDQKEIVDQIINLCLMRLKAQLEDDDLTHAMHINAVKAAASVLEIKKRVSNENAKDFDDPFQEF